MPPAAAERWRAALDAHPSHQLPALCGPNVVVSTVQAVFGFNALTGARAWRHQPESGLLAVAVSADRVVVASRAGARSRVEILGPDGVVMHRLRSRHAVHVGGATTLGGAVLLETWASKGSPTNFAELLDPVAAVYTSTFPWRSRHPVLAGGAIIGGRDDAASPGLERYDLGTGATSSLTMRAARSPRADDETVVFETRLAEGQGVVAVDLATSTELWMAPGAIGIGMALIGGCVVHAEELPSASSRLCARDLRTGELRWATPPAPTRHAGAATDRGYVVGCFGADRLVWLRPEDGSEVAAAPVNMPAPGIGTSTPHGFLIADPVVRCLVVD